MGRNNHNKIRNGNFKNRKFDIKGVRRYVDKIQQAEEASLFLNAMLLFLPWAILFASGIVVSPVYAQGGADVSTGLDTSLFFAGGCVVFVLAVAFAIMLKGRSKKE